MSDGLQQLTNATNTQCYLVSGTNSMPPSVALFVDPMQRSGKVAVASCNGGEIVGTPFLVNLKVTCMTPNLTADKVRERLVASSGVVPPATDPMFSWAMENNLLRINVNLTTLQALTPQAPPTEMVKVQPKPIILTNVFSVTVGVSAPGQTDWSFMEAAHRLSEEGDVSRRLNLGSVSPGPDSAGRADSEASPAARAADPVYVDTSDAPLIRCVVFTGRLLTNSFNVNLTVMNEIGATLNVDVSDRERKSSRKPHPKTDNVKNVVVEEGTAAGEPTLVISFRTDQDFGVLDMAALTNLDIGVPNDPQRPVSHLVAEAQALRHGRYSVSFTATRVTLPLPTEKEVYIVVRTFLEPQADRLDDLAMHEVRDYVFDTFKELNRVLPAQRQELHQLTWGCVRLFVLNTLVEQKEDPSDDLDDIIQSTFNLQGVEAYNGAEARGAAYPDADPYDEL